MSEPLWTLTDVSLGRQERRLDRVSLTIPAGVTAVVGPSGAGKTSLLNLLVGFEQPAEGQVRRRFSAVEQRLPVGWVPADFGLWPHLDVRQHLELVRDGSAGIDAQTSTTDALLDAFGLRDKSPSDVGRLSQGERSRVALARALASDPQVLVLDEPLVHVDPERVDEGWNVIREHCGRRATSIVFSTHSPDVVLREAAHVVCLDGGRSIFAGPVEELYHDPPTARLSRFLGPANWFEPAEVEDWIAGCEPGARRVCLRPEQVDLAEDGDSPLVVAGTRATGLVSISHLKDERTSQVRAVYHRTTRRLAQGMRVLLRMCVVLLLLATLAGCQPSSASPALPMTSTRTLKMPVDGGSIPAPRSLTVSGDGELYVLDKAGRVLVYGSDGMLDRSWFMPEHEIGKPEGICTLADGRVIVADTHYHRVVTFDRNGTLLSTFGALGEGPGEFIYPVSVTTDGAGHLYVAEYGGNDRIQKFTTQGEWLLTMGSFGTDAGQFQRPSGVVWRDHRAADDDQSAATAGTLYVADAINNRVQAFAGDGTFLGVIAGWSGGAGAGDPKSQVDLQYPYDIALGPDGHLFVVEYGAGQVTCLGVDGTLRGRIGGNGRDEGQFWTPWGIAVGGDGRIYVADTGNKRIVELSP